MRKLTLFLFLSIFTALPAFAEEAQNSIDAKLDSVLRPFADFVSEIVFYSIPVAGQSIPIVLLLLAGTSLILTFYFKFVNLSAIGTAFKTVTGKYTRKDAPGEITHFQALSAALSATVGLGNIAGVSIAICAGGPGAAFWMILVGFLGMTSKFCECTLGVKYRKIDSAGKVSGGAMYYLSEGLKERGMGTFGRVLAIFFAVMCVGGALGAGNMFQVNQAQAQFSSVTGLFVDQGWIFGLIVAVLVGAVIIGGIRSIARVTSTLVPLMCGIYIAAALVVLFMNIGAVPAVFGRIISEAFNPDAMITGGFIAVFIQGVKRAAFSNEAGVGSAAIAHSAVRTKEPITEGFVSLLEPFIDTVVICTMTALVITISGQLMIDPTSGNYILDGNSIQTVGGTSGVALTSAAFATGFSWFPYVLAVAVVLFAFSTMISWSYYGLKAWTYLFGESKNAELVFKVMFCVFVVIGAAANLGPVIDFSDAAIFAMAVVNISALYVLMPIVKRELISYQARLKSGEIKKFKN